MVARPVDDGAVVLSGVAAIAWLQLDDWTSEDDVAQRLATTFPDVPELERTRMLADALAMLTDEGLLVRRDA